MIRSKINASAWIRLSLLLLALLNQALVMRGYSPIPLADEDLEEFISLGFIVATSFIASWKDNDISNKARERKELGEKEMARLGKNKKTK